MTSEKKRWSGGHIVITGGTSGIGLSIAKSFLEAGANVCVGSRSLEKVQSFASEFKEFPVLSQQVDVTKDKDLIAFFEAAKSKFGLISCFISAAGSYGEIGPFYETDIQRWCESVAANLLGTARAVHHSLKYLDCALKPRIILFSGGGQGPYENFSSYVTSKGGIWRLTETLGAELAHRNIYLNAITPGPVNTKFLDDLLMAGPDKVGKATFSKSLEQKANGGQSPKKAVDLCHFLLSHKADGLYGKTISAVWDDYQSWRDLKNISTSELYTFKRVIDNQGGTKLKN